MMKCRLDRFGRIVLPKSVRDDLGLEPDTTLNVSHDGERVVLEPVREGEPLAVREGVQVYTGTAVGDLESALQRERERRLRKLASDAE